MVFGQAHEQAWFGAEPAHITKLALIPRYKAKNTVDYIIGLGQSRVFIAPEEQAVVSRMLSMLETRKGNNCEL